MGRLGAMWDKVPNALPAPRVLLVNTPRYDVQSMAKKVMPPLGLLSLASALAREDILVEVLDANARNMNPEQAALSIRDLAPDIVGFPVFSETLPVVERLIGETRKRLPNVRIVLGGPHVSAARDESCRLFPKADFFLGGYAEVRLPRLVKAIHADQGLQAISDLTWRTWDGIRSHARTPETIELDFLPPPGREWIAEEYAQERYYQVMNSLRFDTIVTSRGCPFCCGFCYNAVLRRVSLRSADHVYEEILGRYRDGIRFLEIVDDNFLIDRDRAMRIFQMIIRDGLALSMFVKARSDSVDEEVLRFARKAGVVQISYGIESGDQRLLDAMGKRLTTQQNARAVEMSRKAGILVHAGFVIGYPGETPETIENSLRFCQAVRPDVVSLSILKPYPGTEVYDEARARGTLVGSWDPRTDELPWVRLPWTSSREDLVRWTRWFIRRYYLHPRRAAGLAREFLRHGNARLARFAGQEFWRLLRGRTGRDYEL